MNRLRRRLGWKLFFSYLVIILVGVVSLSVAAQLQVPTALARHMGNMGVMMGADTEGMMADLLANFQTAVNEILLVATTVALLTAVLVSSFVTRRIVRPIQAMQTASQHIASGHYAERVQAAGEDELAELAQAFNQMAYRLEQTETRRRQLIGDVAHELRTPLSSIRSVMEGLVDGVLPSEPATFLSVQREVRRLQKLVFDLEELSKAEAGQLALDLQPIQPRQFVQTAVERLTLQFEDKGVVLSVNYPPALPRVAADGERMTQVMLNLLGNALQYTPSGGQVQVKTTTSGNQLLITIQDSGIGLTAEQLPHIFERFYRVDKSRSRSSGGSGIGLTISKHLVEAHNGRLSATSPGHNQGSTFTVTLPLTA